MMITNVPVSRPTDLRVERHADLNGFGWNANDGLYIPVDDTDSYLFELPSTEQT